MCSQIRVSNKWLSVYPRRIRKIHFKFMIFKNNNIKACIIIPILTAYLCGLFIIYVNLIVCPCILLIHFEQYDVILVVS